MSLIGEGEGAPRVRDLQAENYVMHAHDLRVADEDLRYFLQRRDQLAERLRLGSLAINGASLVALLSILGSTSDVSRLGFGGQTALWSALCFALGMFFAGHSVNATSILYGREAADAYARASALNRLMSVGEAQLTQESSDWYGKALDEYHDLPLTGFQWSPWSFVFQGASTALWLIGVFLPLASGLTPSWRMARQAFRAVTGI